ncbi:MAG: efflux RND transporter periplasmic adaptor subunit [Dokdonella sp.]
MKSTLSGHGRPLLVLGAAVLALGLTACGRSASQAAEAPQARPVIAQVVARGESAVAEHYSGEVHARYEAPASFRIDGKITRRAVGIGERVKAGQLLATLDPSDAAMNALGARAAVAAADSQRQLAQLQRDRNANLRQRGLVSQAQLDQADDALKGAEASLQSARQQLGVRENQVKYASLYAEHDGIVTTQDAEAGQVVTAGQRVFGLAWSDEREVYIAVPESRVAALRENPALKVTLWALQGRSYTGTLRELSASADPQSRTFLAKISIVDAGADVQLQMSADVAIASASAAQAVVLPASALFHKDVQAAVWVIDERSHLQLREVEVVRYVDSGVAIGEGLQPGERVVTRGVHTVHADDLVRIVDLPNAPAAVAAR